MKKYFFIYFVLLGAFVLLSVYLNKSLCCVGFKEEILHIAKDYELDPYLVAAVIKVESSFDKDAVSGKGACGLMQLLPSTAEEICSELNIPYSYEKLFESEYNIKLGCYYLKKMKDIFDSEELALLAYNSGPNALLKYLDTGKDIEEYPYKESVSYKSKVLYFKNFYKKHNVLE